MKFLFQYNSISVLIRRIPVMLKILLNHFIAYITGTPNTITNSPKVFTPISFTKIGKLLLKPTRSTALQTFYYITYSLRKAIFNMKVNMIFAYNSLENANIFSITNLLDQSSTSELNISLKNMITIFGNPNYMRCKPRYGMTQSSLFFFHKPKIQKWVATESLALKVHSLY